MRNLPPVTSHDSPVTASPIASPANAPPHAPAHSQTPPDSSSSPIVPPPNSPTSCTPQTPPHARPTANPPPQMAAPRFVSRFQHHVTRWVQHPSPLRVRVFLPRHASRAADHEPRLLHWPLTKQSARSPTKPVSPATACSAHPLPAPPTPKAPTRS